MKMNSKRIEEIIRSLIGKLGTHDGWSVVVSELLEFDGKPTAKPLQIHITVTDDKSRFYRTPPENLIEFTEPGRVPRLTKEQHDLVGAVISDLVAVAKGEEPKIGHFERGDALHAIEYKEGEL